MDSCSCPEVSSSPPVIPHEGAPRPSLPRSSDGARSRSPQRRRLSRFGRQRVGRFSHSLATLGAPSPVHAGLPQPAGPIPASTCTSTSSLPHSVTSPHPVPLRLLPIRSLRCILCAHRRPCVISPLPGHLPALRWRCPALPPSPPFLPLVRPHLAATPTLPLPRVAAPASLASRAPTRAPFWHRSAVLPCRPPQVVFGSLFRGPPLNLRLGLTLSRPDRGLPSEGVRGALTPPGPVCGGSASYCPRRAPPHPPKRPRPTPPPPRRQSFAPQARASRRALPAYPLSFPPSSPQAPFSPPTLWPPPPRTTSP